MVLLIVNKGLLFSASHITERIAQDAQSQRKFHDKDLAIKRRSRCKKKTIAGAEEVSDNSQEDELIDRRWELDTNVETDDSQEDELIDRRQELDTNVETERVSRLMDDLRGL